MPISIKGRRGTYIDHLPCSLTPLPPRPHIHVLHRHLYLGQVQRCYLFRGIKQKLLDALLAAGRVELYMPMVRAESDEPAAGVGGWEDIPSVGYEVKCCYISRRALPLIFTAGRGRVRG